MATSRLFQEVLANPNPVTLPSTAVVDTSSAEMIGILGNEAHEAYKGYARAGLRQDLRDLSSEVINDQEEIAGVNIEETQTAPEVDYVGRQVALLRQAQESGTHSEASVRIRAERLLREAINRNPGLSMEFKQIAADELGYNPLGSEMAVALQERAAAAMSAAEYRDQVREFAWSHGIDTTLMYGSAEEQRLFFEQVNAVRADVFALGEMERQEQFAAGREGMDSRRARPRIAAAVRVGLHQIAGNLDRQFRVRTEEGAMVDVTTAGASFLASINENDRARMRAALQQERLALNEIVTQQAFLYQIPESEVDMLMGPVREMLNNYERMLEPDAHLAELVAANNTILEMARGQMLGVPGAARVIAMSELTANLPPNSSASIAAMSEISGEVAQVARRVNIHLMHDQQLVTIPSPDDPDGSRARAVALNDVTRYWQAYDTRMTRDGEVEPMVVENLRNAMIGLTRESLRLGPDTPTDVLDTVFNLMTNPRMKDFLDEHDEGGVIRRNLMESDIPRYGHLLGQNLRESVNFHIPTNTRETTRLGSVPITGNDINLNRPIIIPTEEAMYLDISDPNRVRFRLRNVAWQNDSQVREQLSNINRAYADRIQALIQGWSTAHGEDDMAEAARIISASFFWNFRPREIGPNDEINLRPEDVRRDIDGRP